MTARANTSVGYPDPQCAALALNSRYYTAPRMSVPDLRRFLKSSFDDPESCNCCDIPCWISSDIYRLRPETATEVELFPGEYLSVAGFCLRPSSLRFKYQDDISYQTAEAKKVIYLRARY